MIAIGGICSFLTTQYDAWSEGDAGGLTNDTVVISLLFTGMAVYTTILMTAASFRLERVNKFPFFKRREPTRLERASLRREVQGKTPLLATVRNLVHSLQGTT